MLTTTQIAKLLNRPLTADETANYKLYIQIATARLEDVLCMNLSSDEPLRTYYVRSGYRTVFTDPFVETPTVTVDGAVQELGTDYTIRQFDRPNTGWNNSIVFKKHLSRNVEEISVEAVWGFDQIPVDLQLFLAKLFDTNSKEQNQDLVPTTKKIEDFSVTYKENPTLEQVILDNAMTIRKYGNCSQGSIRSGYIYPIR